MAKLTKEYLQKLYNYELITSVVNIDDVVKLVEDKDINDALICLKNYELFNHIINNDEILNFLNIDEPTVDPDDEPTVDPDDEPTVDPEGEEDESPVVDEGEEDE